MFRIRTLVGLFFVAFATLLTWELLITDEQRKLDALLLSEAENAHNLIVHDLRIRQKAVERIGDHMAMEGNFSKESFEEEASAHLADWPGFFGLTWLDRYNIIRFVQPSSHQRVVGRNAEGLGEVHASLVERVRRSGGSQISEAIVLKTGSEMGFVLATPVQSHDVYHGMIWAVFNANEWSKSLYFGTGAEFLSGIEVTFLLDGEPIYASSGFDQIEHAALMSTPKIFNDRSVSLAVKPTRAFLSSQEDGVTELVTALVGILSVVVMIALFGMRDSRLSEQRAGKANRLLVETNRKMHLEVEQRRMAEEQAMRSNAAKSQFLSTMSHEIRTPMNGVLGMAELLETTQLSRLQQGYVDAIRRSGMSLMNTIGDILDFSNFEEGNVGLNNEPCNLETLTKDSVRVLMPVAEKKGLRLSCEVDSGLPKRAMIDPARYRQIILNLVGNAIKFTQQGTVAVRLTRGAGRNLGNCILTVEDTGVGIPPEKIEAIFKAFQQVDENTSRKFDGAGLGLSIVDRLSHAMGGVVDVTSQVGKGSSFKVSLPLNAAPNVDGSSKKKSYAAEDAKLISAARVLLAEDNLTNQKIVAGFLKNTGIDLEIANDGAEAVTMFSDGDYDAVLMDISMPNKNGFDTTRDIRSMELRRSGGSCPIIGYTANYGESDQQKCREAGMNDVIGKPASKRLLSQTLVNWIERSRDQDQRSA